MLTQRWAVLSIKSERAKEQKSKRIEKKNSERLFKYYNQLLLNYKTKTKVQYYCVSDASTIFVFFKQKRWQVCQKVTVSHENVEEAHNLRTVNYENLHLQASA